MSNRDDKKSASRVPSGRVSRLLGFGGMAAGVAGNVMADGAKRLAAGQRPALTDLMLTPKNARRVTQQLAHMRGAAMKIGQMISMDSGDLLPKELADILAVLRSDARHMPPSQLTKVLKSEWGDGWQTRFNSFEPRPIAAASIGQVQRAQLPSGEVLAIKIQYPGVRESIDSDINNAAALIKMTGLIPETMDVDPLIEEARRQLHQEADYLREASYMELFGQLLEGHSDFIVPTYYEALSSDRVLAMSYIESVPIESLEAAPQETRNAVTRALMTLLLRELFEFGAMQTDPNFANYRYVEESDQIVLLDFGACREVSTEISAHYKALMEAALSGSREACYRAAEDIGFIAPDISNELREALLDIIDIILTPLKQDGDFNFGDSTTTERIREAAMPLAGERSLWHLPPPETVFIQRKLGGMFLLATRLRAKVDVRELMGAFVGD